MTLLVPWEIKFNNPLGSGGEHGHRRTPGREKWWWAWTHLYVFLFIIIFHLGLGLGCCSCTIPLFPQFPRRLCLNLCLCLCLCLSLSLCLCLCLCVWLCLLPSCSNPGRLRVWLRLFQNTQTKNFPRASHERIWFMKEVFPKLFVWISDQNTGFT